MWNDLASLASKQGISLPADATIRFARYYELLVEVNKKVNLTRITQPREVMIKHFLDSLELLAWCPSVGGTLLDMGSGAGFPGIPLKIARPDLPVVLLESSRKKADFLKSAVALLELAGVKVLQARAEDLARRDEYRDSFALVVSRAVARLPVLLELCLPLTLPGGIFVAYKGPEAEKEAAEAGRALMELRARLNGLYRYSLPEDFGERTLLFFAKEGPTPDPYPRKAGIPEKRPLV